MIVRVLRRVITEAEKALTGQSMRVLEPPTLPFSTRLGVKSVLKLGKILREHTGQYDYRRKRAGVAQRISDLRVRPRRRCALQVNYNVNGFGVEASRSKRCCDARR